MFDFFLRVRNIRATCIRLFKERPKQPWPFILSALMLRTLVHGSFVRSLYVFWGLYKLRSLCHMYLTFIALFYLREAAAQWLSRWLEAASLELKLTPEG